MIQIKVENAYVRKSEKKEEEYGTWTEAHIACGESDLVLRSFDPAVNLVTLKPGSIVSLAINGEFGKASQYGIRFNLDKLEPIKA
jgi:hypothetical protein